MSQTNPIMSRPVPSLHSASPLRAHVRSDGDGIGRMWQKVEEVCRQLAALVQNVHQIQRQLDRLRRRIGAAATEQGEAYFPFKILTAPTPTDEQATIAEPGSTAADIAWRSFRVRAGAVLTTPVGGTDGADKDPDDTTRNPNAGWDAGIDFVVPANKAHYYVYIDRATNPAAPVIATTDTEPADTWWVGKYILIADIDTQTDLATKNPIIRQYLRIDVPGPLDYCNPDA